jgi:hypothetical protein
VTKNLKGLLNALQQSINEAILESNNVAAAIAALRRTGKCPLFTIEVALEEAPEDAPEAAAEPFASPSLPEQVLGDELVLSDQDVEFLSTLGISDPSWSSAASKAGTA